MIGILSYENHGVILNPGTATFCYENSYLPFTYSVTRVKYLPIHIQLHR